MYRSDELIRCLHAEKPSEQRLGQWFCNTYIKGSWPELFYADDEKAAAILASWFESHHYVDSLPTRLV